MAWEILYFRELEILLYTGFTFVILPHCIINVPPILAEVNHSLITTNKNSFFAIHTNKVMVSLTTERHLTDK